MSRTDKDRPEWVQKNDFTLEMEYRHRHHLFGKQVRSKTTAFGDYVEDAHVITYEDYCTLWEPIHGRPLYWFSDIHVYQFDGEPQYIRLPCFRFIFRRVERRHTCAPHYKKTVMRPKERDFLKAEAKRYNSGYMDGDEYLMDEEVFSTRHYGIKGVGY